LHFACCIPTDRWLLSALQATIREATARWRACDYAGGLELAERFFWGTFCDQYLELVKGRLYDGEGAARASAQATITAAFSAILRLLAPVLPHSCEALYGLLYPGQGSIHTAAWPEPDAALHDDGAEQLGAALRAISGAVRRHKTARSLSLGTPLGEPRRRACLGRRAGRRERAACAGAVGAARIIGNREQGTGDREQGRRRRRRRRRSAASRARAGGRPAHRATTARVYAPASRP